MQTVINFFTICGSILGITAFFLTIFTSIYNYNIKKWDKLSLIIDFNNFEELYDGASQGIIYASTSIKFRNFVRLIRNNSEEIQFKGYAKKKIDKILLKILSETDKFYSEVQAPKWEVWKDSDFIERKINKEYFDENFFSIEEHFKNIDKSIKNASDSLGNIIKLYREVYSLVNMLPYEFLHRKK